MARPRLQFRLGQLVALVGLSAIVIAAVRELGGNGEGRASPIVWAAVGVTLGHVAASRLIVWLDQDSHTKVRSALLVGAMVVGWLTAVLVCGLVVSGFTTNRALASKTGFWLGTGLIAGCWLLSTFKSFVTEILQQRQARQSRRD